MLTEESTNNSSVKRYISSHSKQNIKIPLIGFANITQDFVPCFSWPSFGLLLIEYTWRHQAWSK